MADIVSSGKRSQIMGRIRGQNTGPEMTVRRTLHRMGYRFRLHRKDLPGSPDIVLSKYRAVIFVDGCFWHGHDCARGHKPKSNTAYWNQKILANRKRDERQTKVLRKAGWNVIRLWECEIEDCARLESSLRKILKSRSSEK